MNLTPRAQAEFNRITTELMEFLADNCNPHCTVIVNSDNAELCTVSIKSSNAKLLEGELVNNLDKE